MKTAALAVEVLVGLQYSCLSFDPAMDEQSSCPLDFADSSWIHPQPFLVHCYRFCHNS